MSNPWQYWWLIFVVGPVAGGIVRRFGPISERRHQRRMEIERIRAGHPEHDGGTRHGAEEAPLAPAKESGPDLERVLAEHDAVNTRWLDYELDVAKMIDFPGMSDVREPLTVEYLKAKRRADSLRPVAGENLEGEDFHSYRDAVLAYGHAFDVAERNAHRLKDTAFTPEERQRLATARRLLSIAMDPGATSPERQAAYRRVRKELDGLIAVPQTAFASLERQIAAALDGHPAVPSDERRD
ncbi:MULTISPECIES: hypothetical protein [Arthrobacter]|uniref:Secreted protein n=2 Tax=Arthrobacter TaxID=1663 RepID=A0ABU9KHF9_9MICC|nr:hypothetical protein [Arthrobacter sp. YJM1]MDP5225798.1 hypothetical protein [Arthrobacter sp. YJM1]